VSNESKNLGYFYAIYTVARYDFPEIKWATHYSLKTSTTVEGPGGVPRGGYVHSHVDHTNLYKSFCRY
jgi:hypothetical protein